MKTSKLIESCIELIKQMLGDANNELTSGQREALIEGIRDLKKLQKATRLDHEKVRLVVARIAEAAYEVAHAQVIA
ncbi:hypothetical protein [Terriglobus roseus]|uniref:Uncharacterized protein n=1 Tax=Terriglobus roseus TaxID=392734 RepID=A0A1H4QGI0_9BACT|nr:hypothetical protein [Terriglobus roseus]SEC18612.1 hypothetical protein SAMN05443244_2864 [Terriglobus roseus]